jgi:hypothetical protein
MPACFQNRVRRQEQEPVTAPNGGGSRHQLLAFRPARFAPLTSGGICHLVGMVARAGIYDDNFAHDSVGRGRNKGRKSLGERDL